MTRDETARRLKKVLNEHVKDIDPSSQALFSINRRIRDTDSAENHLGFLRSLKPAYVFGALTLALLGVITGVLITRTTASPDIQVATPATSGEIELPLTSDQPAVALTEECPSDLSDKHGYVNIYFYCSGSLVARYRAVREDNLNDALELLFAGPTQAEQELGFSSEFIDATDTLTNTITISNGWAVIDFSQPIKRSSRFLAQINETVFDFEEIQLVEYRANGTCINIADSSSSETCNSYTRNGVRSGNGDRRIVAFEETPQGNRTIYSCPNTSSCQSLGLVNVAQTFRYTGGQKQNGGWLEILAPTGEIGWVSSQGVSVQVQGGSTSENLYQIAQSISALSNIEGTILQRAFSTDGVYISYVTQESGTYARSHIMNPGAEESRDEIVSVLEKYIDAVPIEPINPPIHLANIEYVSVRAGDNTINTYFDFQNGYAEIVAISIHPDS